MTDKEVSPLSASISRGLTDKLVERRKAGALELERMVKDLIMMNDYSQIKQVISALEHDFTLSSNPNCRKGGLVGLAATAIALGRGCIGMNLPELVQPVLTCFEDQDARVRYYACESLYNISKVARGAVLVFFNNMFQGLCKLSCDSDSNVRYGAELLDRLMKDVVSENPHFDIDNFILLLRDRIYSNDAFARQFLVSWISFLDSVPDIHMHEHIPEFIDGLFCILGDQRKEIRRLAEDTIGELLKEVQQHAATTRFHAMANILAVHSQSDDKLIQFTALMWLKVFLDLAQRSMMVFTSNILVSILPCVAYDSDKSHIRDIAVTVNDRLKKLILPEDDEDMVTDVVDQNRETTPQLTRKATGQAGQTGSSPQRQMGVGSGGGGSPKPGGGPRKGASSSPQLPPPTSNGPSALTVTDQTTSQIGQTDKGSDLSAPSPQPSPSQESGPASSNVPDPSTSGDDGDVNGRGGAKLPIPKLHLLAVLGVLIPHMKYTQQETRIETLRWIKWLHEQLPKRVYKQAGKLFLALVDMVTDQSDKVVRAALGVIAILSTSTAGLELETEEETCKLTSSSSPPGPSSSPHGPSSSAATPTSTSSSSSPASPHKLTRHGSTSRHGTPSSQSVSKTTGKGGKQGGGASKVQTSPTPAVSRPHLNKYFRRFLVELLRMFDSKRWLLERKGSFIIRHLCVYVDAHCVYCTLAEILYAEENLGFASLMVQMLNMILFTAMELYELRMQLKELETQESWKLFTTLYRSWCHNPIATVAICLLSQNYDHASNLVCRFSEIEITADLLRETDKLVQLLESPIFSFLRLQLLEPQEHASLVRTLSGLLMVVPQSDAFHLLKKRLGCVPVITVVQEVDKKRKRSQRRVPTSVSFDELLEHFVSMQKKHSVLKRKNITQGFRSNPLSAN